MDIGFGITTMVQSQFVKELAIQMVPLAEQIKHTLKTQSGWVDAVGVKIYNHALLDAETRVLETVAQTVLQGKMLESR